LLAKKDVSKRWVGVRCEVLFGIKPRAYQESVRLCRCPSLLETITGEHKDKKDKETDTSINHQVTSLSLFYYLTVGGS
jgi:hypothetical protein